MSSCRVHTVQCICSGLLNLFGSEIQGKRMQIQKVEHITFDIFLVAVADYRVHVQIEAIKVAHMNHAKQIEYTT